MSGSDMRPAGTVRSTARAPVPDWRNAAAWWVRREFGRQSNGLIRILDVCQIAEREAWVSLEAEGRHVVVGLRHEAVTVDDAGTFTADDGWYRLLYLTVIGDASASERDNDA